MELLILKNGTIFARAVAEENGAFELVVVPDEDVPAYPTVKPAIGYEWELEYYNGILSWVEKERPLTTEERLEKLQQDVEQIKLEWKVGEAVKVGDRRYYNGVWYTCLQAHTTQADWTPDVVPALWKAD